MQAIHARSAPPAFTLVEMLVVLGVLGALLALSLPALSSVRASGRALQCQANQRQMAVALELYAQRWEAYPTALRYEAVDGAIHRIAWDWVTTFAGDDVIGTGPLWSTTNDPDKVMQCPDYGGPANFAGDPHTGYNYNTSYIGGEAAWVAVGWQHVRKGAAPHACRRVDQCAAFGCGGYSGGANKFMRAPGNPEHGSLYVTYTGGQAFRHAGSSTNAAFLDGHVKSHGTAFEGTPATAALLNVMGFPESGFLSDDDGAYAP